MIIAFENLFTSNLVRRASASFEGLAVTRSDQGAFQIIKSKTTSTRVTDAPDYVRLQSQYQSYTQSYIRKPLYQSRQ